MNIATLLVLFIPSPGKSNVLQYAKSITSPESAPLTAEALTSYFNYIIQNGVNPPSVSSFISSMLVCIDILFSRGSLSSIYMVVQTRR